MKTDQSLIVSGATQLPVFTLTPEAKSLKEAALTTSALVGKVSNAEQNATAVNAQKELKRISSLFESQRKKLKEPLLEAGRQLDRTVQAELLEIEQEYGRISALTSEFQLAEQRRIREEEELQRKELERIEREKQAEIARIAREQREREEAALKVRLEAERKAREEREAAEKLVRDAANAKQRAEAEKARKEAEERARIAQEQQAKVDAELKAQAEKAAAMTAQVEEKAAVATYAESRPIQATRETGQVVKTDWDVIVTNPWELAKFHPDCVKIEPLMTPIKAALNEGRTVRGITATKKTTATVRAGAAQPRFIEV